MGQYLYTKGFALNLNLVNFYILILRNTITWNSKRYLNALAEAIKGAAGILLQFPFYAGIMGIMVEQMQTECHLQNLCQISL